MSTVDALAWYEAAARGRVTIPLTAMPVDVTAPAFGVEPALGRFCVGETIPFSAQWHGGPRVHRLVPMEDPAEAIQKLDRAPPPASGLPPMLVSIPSNTRSGLQASP